MKESEMFRMDKILKKAQKKYDKGMKKYGLVKEGYDNLNEPTLTVVIGNLTLKEAEKIKRVLEQETSNVYRIEDNSELAK